MKGSRLLPILLILWSFRLSAQQVDSLKDYFLQEVIIDADAGGHAIGGDLNNSVSWSMRHLEGMPKLLGVSDPLHYLQTLPGVQTTSELSGGLHVNGSEDHQNYISIEGIRVYNPSHLLGFFSVFNTSHFENMNFSKWSSIDNDCIGARLDMRVSKDTLSNNVFQGSVGLIGSQFSAGIKTGRKSVVRLSARSSYINMLYTPLLRADNYNEWTYRFSDVNLTYVTHLNERNIIVINGFRSLDKFRLNMGYGEIDTHIDWTNVIGSAAWKHNTGSGYVNQIVYYSGYENTLLASDMNSGIDMPSHIRSFGYKLDGQIMRGWSLFRYGTDITRYQLQLQTPCGKGEWVKNVVSEGGQSAGEALLFFNTVLPLDEHINLTMGLRGTLFRSNRTFISVDPQLELDYVTSGGSHLMLRAGIQHQYLHQIGFSGSSMPSEFWMASTDLNRPERSFYTSLGLTRPFLDNMYVLSADIYYKRLYGQMEYVLNPIDLYNSSQFNLQRYIMHGSGHNVGFGLFVQKNSGSFTGWLSYYWNRSLRTFHSNGNTISSPSVYERPHEINIAAKYNLSEKWNLSSTFVFASGTPCTQPQNMYIIAGTPVCTFGGHNASRLPAYKRLDLSAEYCISSTTKGRHSVDFSLYNALFSKNVLFYYIRSYRAEQRIGRYGLYLFRICIPSISYSFRF